MNEPSALYPEATFDAEKVYYTACERGAYQIGKWKKRNLQVNTTLNADSATRACVLGI